MPRLRQFKIILFTAALLLPLTGQAYGSILPEALWNWGGSRLLEMAQGRLRGKVTAQEITGNPLTGLAYKDLVLTDPQGREILRADRLELRFSAQSLTSLYPVVAHLALINPRLNLVQEEGRWNFARLAPPPKPGGPAPPSAIMGFFLRELDLEDLVVQGGAIELTQNGVTRRFTDLNLKSAVTLANLATSRPKIDLKSADLGVTTPQGRVELGTSLSYSPDLVEINRLAMQLAGRQVLSMEGQICEPLQKLTCKFRGRLGPLPGAQIHEVWSRWPAPWDLRGKFSFAGSPEGMELAAAGEVGRTGFDLKGRLQAPEKPGSFELNLDLKGLAPAQLQEIKGLEAEKLKGLSAVDAHLRLNGQGTPWKPEQVKADLKLAPFQYREVKVKRLEFNLAGDSQRQDLHAQVEGNFGALTLDSRGRLLPGGTAGPGPSGEATLKATEFQPARLGLGTDSGTVLTGALAGKFHLPPDCSLTGAQLAGQVTAQGRWNELPLNECRSQFSLQGSKLHLSEANLRLGTLTASFTGDLSPRGLELAFSAQASGSQGLPVPSPVAFASLKAAGTVKGAWREPRLTLTATGNQVALSGVKLETADLTADLSGWPPQQGSLNLKGTKLGAAGGSFSQVELSARGEAGRWGFKLAAASPQYPRVRLAGTAELRERPLAVRIDQFAWQDQRLALKNRAPFQLRFLPGLEISPATFQVDGGLITVQGLVRGEEVSGRMEIQNLDAKLLSLEELPAQGKINGKLTLAGTPQAPLVRGSLAVESGKVSNIPFQALTTTLDYEAERLKVNGYLEESLQHSRLAWTGTVPLKLSLLPLKFTLGERDLYLRIHTEKANLCLVACLSKEITDARSPLNLLVEMRGDPHQPQISGYIRWSEGRLQLEHGGTSYQLAAGEIRLQGDKVVIPGLTLTSEGTLRLTGSLELGGGTAARIRAQADNFLVLNRGGNQIWANGQVDLKGPFNALVATGHLVVPKAQFRPTFFRSEHDPDIVLVSRQAKPHTPAPFFYRNLRADVAIDSPGHIWLKDPIGEVEMAGKLKATKQPGQKLALRGEIHALKGTVDVQDRDFKVERAVMKLPGIPGQPVTVDGKAVHVMDEITLVLTVTGSVSNPNIRLESLPPLPPSDVLAYLVFGAPTARLTKEQYYALGAQTLGGLGGLTSKKMGELVGSSLPFLGGGVAVKSGMVGERATLGVEKKLTQNVSVSYQRNFNEERGQYERQVVIDYKINKNFSVESQLGTRNSGADVFFNHDF
jgi:autotransporter translocation and assembly factor TamB